MSPDVRRAYDADGYTFEVSASTDELRSIARTTFIDLASSETPPAHTYRLTRVGPQFVLEDGPNRRQRFHSSASDLIADLVTLINRRYLDHDADRLHLHAGAAVNSQGRGTLIVAPSGGGKTTTMASLIAAGWTYVTDETVAFNEPTEIFGFPKPLSVKRSGFSMFRTLTGESWTPPFGDDARQWAVSVGSLGGSTTTRTQPRLIVVLDHTAESAHAVAAMSPAETTIALVEQSMDFDRFGPSGLELMAQLVSRCTCVRLFRKDPSAMAHEIDALANEDPMEHSVRSLEPVDAGDFEPVTTVSIDHELVLRNQTSGLMVSLSDGAAELWRAFLKNEYALADPDAEKSRFFAQLKSAGILTTRTN